MEQFFLTYYIISMIEDININVLPVRQFCNTFDVNYISDYL